MLAANPKKFQMLVLGEKTNLTLNTDSVTLTSVETVELLGIEIDKNLNFSGHISNLCRRAKLRLHSLNRIRNFLQRDQLLLLVNSYILSVFNYGSIIWMFHGKVQSREIDNIQKRALRATFQDLETLLQISKLKRVHETHLRFLVCEINKTLNSLNPSFMQTLYTPKQTQYALRKCNLLVLPPAKSTRFGTQSFLFRGSLLWNTLPDSLKSSVSLNSLKILLKKFNLCIYAIVKFVRILNSFLVGIN